jgi:thioredoxin-related protein
MRIKNVILIATLILLGGTMAFLVAEGNQDGGDVSKGTEGTVFDENAYPPNGWTVSMAAAATEAKESGKMILMNFTGSDWCSWCIKLESEVFSTPEFLTWADENLVMVFLDSPSTLQLEEKVIQQNQILQQALGVQGFPTLLLLDSDLTPLLRTGYQAGGVQAYISHLENDRIDISEEEKGNFRNGFTQLIEDNLLSLDI